MPTYHPAYLLRTPSAKREVWEDMKRVRDLQNSRDSDSQVRIQTEVRRELHSLMQFRHSAFAS